MPCDSRASKQTYPRLEQREEALVYLARKTCPGNRAEAELELLRVQEAITSAHTKIDALQ